MRRTGKGDVPGRRGLIEMVTDAYGASPLTMKLHDSLDALYKS
jgi:hypothetical protein